MFISFEELDQQSRVWVYQADRPFGEGEEKLIATTLQSFCDQWSAHGNALKTSFKIEEHQFIILAVDESTAGASGCSIDGSVRMLKEIQQAIGINLFDRTRVAFSDRGNVVTHPLPNLKTAFSSGVLSGNTITFNTMVQTKADFGKNWKIPAEKSWLVKYLPKTTLQD
jgi:hypothetical protein